MKATLFRSMFCTLGLVIASSSMAWADCNGTNAPLCDCGDTVITSQTLTSADPVTSTSAEDTCPGDGLIVPPGVSLDLGNETIRGSGSGTGIVVQSGVGGAIENGQIRGFGTGIGQTGAGAISGRVFTELTVAFNEGPGISLTEANNNEISHVQALANRGDGVAVTGNGNDLFRISCQRNGDDGMDIIGNNNTLTANRCQQNADHEILVEGNFNELTRNLGSGGGTIGSGVRVIGNNNELFTNQAHRNRGHGVRAEGTGNITNFRNYGTANTAENCLIDGQPPVDDNRC